MTMRNSLRCHRMPRLHLLLRHVPRTIPRRRMVISKEDAVAKTLEFPNEEPHEPVTQEDAVAKALEVEGEKPHEPVTQRADRLVAPYVIAKPTKRPGVELSQGAIYKRMNRIFTPRSDGTYLVDEEFVRKWKNLDTRDELNILFEKCDYQPDTRLCLVLGFTVNVG